MESKERGMLTALLLLAAAVHPAAVPAATDPPIRLWYSSGGDYAYGDRAKIYAKAAESGYLVVLRSDMRGHIRVLAPVDPADDQHVTGGKKYELKGRGGREAFVAEDSTGQGIVVAAWSKTPFDVAGFVRNGMWDYDALAGTGAQSSSDDAEARILEIVHDMQAPGEHFEYDLATYTVTAPSYAHGFYPYPYPYGYAGMGWWGFNPWWGFGPRFGATRIVVVPRHRR
jgi:Domain of unknown function (DUF4384)